MKALLEITKESGEVIIEKKFDFESSAHDLFEKIELIKSPNTYRGLIINATEYFTGGNIGSFRVVALSEDGKRYVRRELYRNA